ncbi:helix-turn-helix domain-containing protein [Frigoribacterium sp. CFBP9039]|nr:MULTISPECIES: helix-turn-helix domain-containing protein [Frigoribacterium]MCJ0700645.1 helix-turn-helix transcriptional regulator [Frigoribacterium faeni]MDY0947039.1 helix-turn-helix domain-containing protein [Frigoribacterium sp. CFBP9039]
MVEPPAPPAHDRGAPARFPAACPSRVVLTHVTSRWGVLVLLALEQGGMRWGELRRTIEGISEKMLASTLRTLEHDGIVNRVAQPTIPPRVDYSLTESGAELAARLVPLMDWIVEHADTIVDRSSVD